jgi:hypothetical protein
LEIAANYLANFSIESLNSTEGLEDFNKFKTSYNKLSEAQKKLLGITNEEEFEKIVEQIQDYI